MASPPQFSPPSDESFSNWAASWWDPEGPVRTLHHLNPVRLAWIQQVLGPLAGRTLLDVGCGGGILSEALAQAGAHVTGLDTALALIQTAKRHAVWQRDTQSPASWLDHLHYHAMPLETWAADHPNTADAVICMEMLEHVSDPVAVLQAAYRVLQPGGLLLLSTINRTPWAFFSTIAIAEYVWRLVPRGTHSYGAYIRPSELSQWIYQAGMIPRATQGIGYDPLRHQAYLTPSIAANYFLWAQKPTSVDKRQ